MQDKIIEKFGSKLMVSSQSVNKIPEEYLSYSQNARIYDLGIGPRAGKTLLTDSTLGTENKGAFFMNGVMYQIANSNIYSIDLDSGVQTLVVSLGYDKVTDILVYGADIAIIVSAGEVLQVFDGVGISTPGTVPAGDTGGIIEYTRGFSFYAIGNILYISEPITAASPQSSYDFTGGTAQNITFDSTITGLKGTLNGIYIFTEDKVEFIGANSLQNVSGSATFISTPLGFGGEPINALAIAASGDKIFYVTKNLQIRTINYVSGTETAQIGELSSRTIVGIKELLKTIDTDQPSAFGLYNKNDQTIQFHLRTINNGFNNIVIVYDLINDSWNLDTGKNYNYVLENGPDYYGFSDVNTSIYKDDDGLVDAGSAIPFVIRTQWLNQGTIRQKRYGGILTSGSIGPFTTLDYTIFVDGDSVFLKSIEGNDNNINGLGEIGGNAIGGDPIGGDINDTIEREIFDRLEDEGGLDEPGKRIKIQISSTSQIQDFVVDFLGYRFEATNNTDISNRF